MPEKSSAQKTTSQLLRCSQQTEQKKMLCFDPDACWPTYIAHDAVSDVDDVGESSLSLARSHVASTAKIECSDSSLKFSFFSWMKTKAESPHPTDMLLAQHFARLLYISTTLENKMRVNIFVLYVHYFWEMEEEKGAEKNVWEIWKIYIVFYRLTVIPPRTLRVVSRWGGE